MAKKVQINIAIDSKNGEKSIGDLNKEAGKSIKTIHTLQDELNDLNRYIKDVDVGSDAFKDMAGRAKELSAELKDINSEMKGLTDTDIAQAFASTVSGFASITAGALAMADSLGLVDKENDEMTKTLVAGIAVANSFSLGMNGIIKAQELLKNSTIASTIATKGGTVAMRVFNAVTKANPIGLLVTALLAAVSAFALFNSSSKGAEENTKAMDEAQRRLNETSREYNRIISKRAELEDRGKLLTDSKEALSIEGNLLKLKQQLNVAQRDENVDKEELIKIQKSINQEELNLINVRSKEASRNREAAVKELKERFNRGKSAIEQQKQLIDSLYGIERIEAKRTLEAMLEVRENQKQEIVNLGREQRNELAELDNQLTRQKIANENAIYNLTKRNQEEVVKDVKLKAKEVNQLPITPIPTKLVGLDDIETYEERMERIKALTASLVSSIQSDMGSMGQVIDASFNGSFEEINASFAALTDDMFDSILKLNEHIVENGRLSWEQVALMAVAAMQMAVSAINSSLEAQRESERQARADKFNEEEEELKASLTNRSISEEEYANRLAELEQQKQQSELQAKRKAFKESKAIQIANAVMQTANAVLAAFASAAAVPIAGIALGPIMAGVAGALGAVQIGIISAQKFQAARGGVVPGQPSMLDSVDAQLAPGEMVINSQSAQMFPEILSSINQAGGGVALAPSTPRGGRADSTRVFEDNRRQGPMKAYVVESEVTTVQNRVSRIERQSEF